MGLAALCPRRKPPSHCQAMLCVFIHAMTTSFLSREEESLENIKQYYVECMSEEAKYQAISNIYGVITIGQAIIFCHVSHHAQLCLWQRFDPVKNETAKQRPDWHGSSPGTICGSSEDCMVACWCFEVLQSPRLLRAHNHPDRLNFTQ